MADEFGEWEDVFVAYWSQFGLLKAAAVNAMFGLRGYYDIARSAPTQSRSEESTELLLQTIESSQHCRIDRPQPDCTPESIHVILAQVAERAPAPVAVRSANELAKLCRECVALLEVTAHWQEWQKGNPLIYIPPSCKQFAECRPAELIRRIWAIMRALDLKNCPALPSESESAHDAIRALDDMLTCCRRNSKLGGQDIQTDGEPAEPANESSPDSPTGFMGGAELADALRVHSSQRMAFSKQLERERPKLADGCWIESANRRPNAPQYLYWASDPAIQSLAAPYRQPKPA